MEDACMVQDPVLVRHVADKGVKIEQSTKLIPHSFARSMSAKNALNKQYHCLSTLSIALLPTLRLASQATLRPLLQYIRASSLLVFVASQVLQSAAIKILIINPFDCLNC